ncbi:MAG: hypothetical protein GY745_03915 [Actinomycetia bacterium]|nr:hypothetical protein [Actinomycetes bacterium]
MGRILPILIAAALITASCGGSDGDVTTDVDPVDDSTTSTSTGAPTTGSTTPTTLPPTDSTSVVISRLYAIGGWTGSEWEPYEGLPPADIPARDGDTFRVSVVDGGDGATTVGGDPEETCEPLGVYGIPTSPELFYEFGEPAPIAVKAAWDISPRPVLVLDPIPSVYQGIISEFLEGRGIDDPVVEIIQAVKTDLQGDGVDEVVLVAEHHNGFFNEQFGDYSLVLLRTVVDEVVQTAVLGESLVLDATDPGLFVRYRLSTLADLNGDAKLEVVTTSTYYEGAGTSVWEYINDELGPTVVMSAACGA